MPPEPAAGDGTLDAYAELIRRTACLQELRVDQLDVNLAVLHSFDAVRYLNQLAGGNVDPVATINSASADVMSAVSTG